MFCEMLRAFEQALRASLNISLQLLSGAQWCSVGVVSNPLNNSFKI